MSEHTERAFQRSLRDVRKVGLRQARTATKALVVRKQRLSRRNRAFTITEAFTSKSKPGSLFGQIGSALLKTAKGEAPFPIPGFGGTGRAMQIRAIGRQQLARVPLPAKIVGGAVGVTAATEAITGQSPIPLIRQSVLGIGRHIATKKPGIPFQPDFPGGFTGGHKKMAGRLAVGQELPPSHIVVRTWQTFPGGPVFARLADGHIAVQKKDGTIKHFRPYRPVVIPRKWNARSMSRVATALKRQRKTATKIMQITGGMPKGRR